MATPATGAPWRQTGLSTVDSRFNDRGGLCAILIRNNRGAATNISPWSAGSPPVRNWSPLADDGQPRDDLFAFVQENGEWITNPDPNEGFILVGALSEAGGPERAPDIKEDNQMILQSNFPFDTDLVSEGMVISFTGVETLKPSLKRLRMNVPLQDGSGNQLTEDPGTEQFSLGKPTDVEAPEWQIILMFSRLKAGRRLYRAEGYSLCKLTKLGNFRRSKTDPDAGELGYTVLPDPYLMTKDPADPTSDELIPALYVEWIDGDAWRAIGGVPIWPGTAPTGTPGTTGTATLVSVDPTGAGDPFTVTAEKSLTPFSTFSPATIASVNADTPTPGTSTYHLSGLTAGANKFRLVATGTNGQKATTAVSASVTVI